MQGGAAVEGGRAVHLSMPLLSGSDAVVVSCLHVVKCLMVLCKESLRRLAGMH